MRSGGENAGTLAARLRAQLLTGEPAAGTEAVTEQLLAVQAQDPRGARLAVRARTAGLTAADVDRALTDDHSVVITWLNRGTLHLVRSDDVHWLHALTTPQLATASARRLAQEGVSPAAAERGVAIVEQALAGDGPQTREQLRDRLERADVPVAGQAFVHVLLLASNRGVLVRGPMLGKDHAFVLARDWLGDPPPVDRDTALAELARRYLRGHGPAGDRDLARWAGVRLRDARGGLRSIAGELDERPDGLVALRGDARDDGELGPPRLLGPFDPLLLGWVSREAIVGPHRHLVTVNGLFRAFALVGGRAVATWRMRDGRVELEPLEPMTAGERRAIAAEAGDVERFLGA